ncbi:MAG: LuxR C-terminal-related transcriptional regulator [Pseudolabrys sp.]
MDRLTQREQEILAGVVAGHSNKTIGRELNISPRTVEGHRKRIRQKLGCRNTADLVRATMSREREFAGVTRA